MTEQRQQETPFVRSDCSSLAGMKRFSHEAMATTFEILIVHEDERYARQAAMAAFTEVDRLEGELQHYTTESISHRVRKNDEYATTAAEELYRQGKRASMLQLLFLLIPNIVAEKSMNSHNQTNGVASKWQIRWATLVTAMNSF